MEQYRKTFTLYKLYILGEKGEQVEHRNFRIVKMLCMMDTCHYTFFETDRKYITKSKPWYNYWPLGYYVSMQFHVINVVIVPNVPNVPLCWDMLIMGEAIAFLEQFYIQRKIKRKVQRYLCIPYMGYRYPTIWDISVPSS